MGLEKITQGRSGLLLYGFTPPKSGLEDERLRELGSIRASRLRALPLDGCVVYDVQDESSRNAEQRPFPYLPTIGAVEYARGWLGSIELEKIVYVPVSRHSGESLERLISSLDRGQAIVLVGSPSARQALSLPLAEAFRLAAASPSRPLLGAVSIPERHAKKGDEHLRAFSKSDGGARFFVSQCVYDTENLKNYLSDYHYACLDSGRKPAYQVFTLTVCGSEQTLGFMRWLGISVPHWLEADLRRSKDILTQSLDRCAQIACEVADFCRGKSLPFGFNVESLSNKKAEIEASGELVRRVREVLARP
jgi:hypothetical protein